MILVVGRVRDSGLGLGVRVRVKLKLGYVDVAAKISKSVEFEFFYCLPPLSRAFEFPLVRSSKKLQFRDFWAFFTLLSILGFWAILLLDYIGD